MSSVIEAVNLVRKFQIDKNNFVQALGPVSFVVPKNSFTIIIGRSGSGKSTLLNLLTGLDKPTAGELYVLGQNLAKLDRKQLAKYRSKIGIIFQQYNLIPNLTALENVLMGSWSGGGSATVQESLDILEQFDLKHRATVDVSKLSGGEKQRVAVCRALINKPEILFCDEPTGALDSKNEENVREILVKLHKQGMTIVMVTHNLDFQDIGTQVFKLDDGLLSVLKHDGSTNHNQIVVRKYKKAQHNKEDLWLFRDFLDEPEIYNHLSNNLPEEDTKVREATLLCLKSIITEISDHFPGKRVFPFGFLPIAKDFDDNLIVYFLEDKGIYYLDREIFLEDAIKVVKKGKKTIKRYETRSIVSHAEKVFRSINDFMNAVYPLNSF